MPAVPVSRVCVGGTDWGTDTVASAAGPPARYSGLGVPHFMQKRLFSTISAWQEAHCFMGITPTRFPLLYHMARTARNCLIGESFERWNV
jgi:hypothetical protein